MSQIIDIPHARTCNCNSKYLSCITPKEWMKNQIGVWTFAYEERDIRDKNVHPAVFPLAMARRVIEQFTHEGELVIDPFVGSGTTLLAAQDLRRNAVGFDLNPEYVNLANSRLACDNLVTHKQMAVCDDARNIKNRLLPETVKLAFTSPPYANMLNRKRKNKSRRGDKRDNEQYDKIEQYSQDPRDLGLLDAQHFENDANSISGQINQRLDDFLEDCGGSRFAIEMDERLTVIAALADSGVDRQFTQQGDIVFLGQLFSGAGGEDVGNFAAFWADESAHIFDDTEDREFHLLAEID